jgi:hypothetical protein
MGHHETHRQVRQRHPSLCSDRNDFLRLPLTVAIGGIDEVEARFSKRAVFQVDLLITTGY